MNKTVKRLVVLALTTLIMFTAFPAVKAMAAEAAPVHTALTSRGKGDKMELTYKLTLDKTLVSDGRIAVTYDTEALVLKSKSVGGKFDMEDLNCDYEDSTGKGIAYAFVNDSAKKTSGTLVSLKFSVKKGLSRRDSVIATHIFGLCNEDTTVVADSTLEDIATVGVGGLSKPAISAIKQTLLGVDVQWGRDAEADGYEVYRSTSGDGKYSRVALTSFTDYLDLLVWNNQTYYYKVRSYRGSGSSRVYSEYSDVKSVKVRKFMIF
ncbi:hypothetical protein [Butyrivibrio sp. MC2013]|uniref:hypothetical protein n=1 Tax=Butyrivibrio sp. MC2013 TaxID=1280686 RepID=UPI0003F9CCCF|nr:hypothetical protein [Butyrivibrio sp. MC2013]